MENFYNITSDDFNEIIFDSKSIFKNLEKGSSTEYTYNDKFGHYYFSTEKKGNIYLSHFNLNFNKNIALVDSTLPIIGININKNNNTYHKFNKNKKDVLKFNNHHCGLFFMNEGTVGKSFYKQNVSSELISFNFFPDFFESLNKFYPETLGDCYQRFKNGESFVLYDTPIPLTHEMQQIITQIENASLLGNTNTMYIEAKVFELLALQFSFDKKTIANKNLCIKTLSDKEKIIEAKSILISDLSNTPHLRELSLKVGINEKKLKNGFKEVFGTTVFGYLFQHKMQLAKEYLLNTNLPINEIAILCGYDYPSHFSTAFKRFFGLTPLEYRNTK